MNNRNLQRMDNGLPTSSLSFRLLRAAKQLVLELHSHNHRGLVRGLGAS